MESLKLVLPVASTSDGCNSQNLVGTERETLLEAILPAPDRPHAKRRAISAIVVVTFLLLTVYLAATGGVGAGLMDHVRQGPTKNVAEWSSTDQLDEPTVSTAEDDDADDDSIAPNHIDVVEYDDFAAPYLWHRDLEWDIHSPGRLIIVGDVHGMLDSLKEMLFELDFNGKGRNDTLVFVGDLVAKHPDVQASLDTVDYIRSLPNTYAIRGNHDQDVLNWRKWLAATQSTDEMAHVDSTDPPEQLPSVLKHKWRNEHHQIAATMSAEAAHWLHSLSLTLHIRSIHTYVVHAGLLPWVIPKNRNKHGAQSAAEGQQASEVAAQMLGTIEFPNEYGVSEETNWLESLSPTTFEPTAAASFDANKAGALDPEMAILLSVPQNREPYTLLEMRSLLKDNVVTKSAKRGRPWAPIWNTVMAGCQLLSEEQSTSSGTRHKCRPLNVVYGHAASRGLDLRDFSFGLDSGAVYGRALSAMVIGGSDSPAITSTGHRKGFSLSSEVTISGHPAAVYSLKCSKP